MPPPSLTSLPPEILLDIFEYLTPVLPSMHERDESKYGMPGECPSGDATWFQKAAWPSTAHVVESRVRRRTLIDLCLSCRRLRDAGAASALYRNVAIGSSRQMVQFFRTVVLNPALASATAEVSFLWPDANAAFAREVAVHWDAQVRSRGLDVRRLGAEALAALTSAGFVAWRRRSSTTAAGDHRPVLARPPSDDVASGVAAVILALCRHAADLQLRLPLHAGQYRTSSSPGPVAGLWHFEYEEPAPARRVVEHASVTALRLKADCNLDEWSDKQLCVSFAPFPDLRTLEMGLDRSNLVFEEREDLSRVENLRLVHVVASLDFVADLVRRCTGLRALYIDCVPSYADHVSESSPAENILGEALRRTPELTSLHLQFSQRWRGAYYGDPKKGDRMEADVRLGSLRHLAKLESLRVETMSFWTSPPPSRADFHLQGLHRLLPPSLRRLELVEVRYINVWPPTDTAESYGAHYFRLVDLFRDVAYHRDELPHLREIVFRPTNPVIKVRDICLVQCMAVATDALRSVGIVLVIDWPGDEGLGD